MTDVTVLIPTLNEADNVDPLLARLLRIRSENQLNFEILFIDSASKDGTGEKVRRWNDHDFINLLQRDVNVGLASAVIAGATRAQTTFVLVMDADLSHPPEDIPKLLSPLRSGTHDMVIGSRYAPGGGMENWPLKRKFFSRLATWPALFLSDVKDPLAGFFAVERSKITELPRNVPGFKIGLAILAEYGNELRTLEIPILFKDRDCGESKMTKRVIADYLRQLTALYFRKIFR